MKNISVFLSEKFRFLEVKLSIYLNRRVFVMLQMKLLRKAAVIQHIISHIDHGQIYAS